MAKKSLNFQTFNKSQFVSLWSIIPDNNPPRHANIINWPAEKSEQKLIAIELAENSQLHLK